MLISDLVVGFMKNVVGADFFVSGLDKSRELPEQKLREFLFAQKSSENPIVEDYSFGSGSVKGYMRKH